MRTAALYCIESEGSGFADVPAQHAHTSMHASFMAVAARLGSLRVAATLFLDSVDCSRRTTQ
eukprot:4609468-Pleurochrysis_carterae.AAC.2